MKNSKLKILLTGGAGFIGSHILDALIADERVSFVRVLDNLSTGRIYNMARARGHGSFEFVEEDIRDKDSCERAVKDMDLVCHQAALGSVPRSLENPLKTHAVNATGTLNIFEAARKADIRRIVFASSSAVYGDSRELPKRERQTGRPRSPYAVTKKLNEEYAAVYAEIWTMQMIGLRYFNVYGPRQSPDGPYAAVIPSFINRLIQDKSPVIYGDGAQSRDFTYVDLAVRANIAALFKNWEEATFSPLNIARGRVTTLNDLHNILTELLDSSIDPDYRSPRPGDIRHSRADVSKAMESLDYSPDISLRSGLLKTIHYYK